MSRCASDSESEGREMEENVQRVRKTAFSHLPKRPPVDIEFQDLTYSVPQGRKGPKLILRGINGKFRSGHLTAILGPSGAGKSTLLNILAGYKCKGATGAVLVNGESRNMRKFRHMSRYIMQEDLIQPMLSVDEVMMLAANLKLSSKVTECDKWDAITEILELLRLSSTRTTFTNKLSGGERKRLSIALELLNNPPVLFLDEPTTGLDDMASSQCVSLLKQLAQGGRTVICSVHTPSARLVSMFDNVYIISYGQCTYQGCGDGIVPYLSNIGIICPTHYNPADFVIELCCGEYGDFQDILVSTIDNGKNLYHGDKVVALFESCPTTISNNTKEYFDDSDVIFKNSAWMQFKILIMRMWLQMWRDKNYLLLKVVMHILLGILIGNMYLGMAVDASKTIFNFGFYFTCVIFFMYMPMMPVLLSFPLEVQYIKREHFNKWYGLGSYFTALSLSTLPVQIVLGSLYLSMVYLLSQQPLELGRVALFFTICFLTSVISESFGLLISSSLNVVHSMFVGPVMLVPFMVLSAYGFGEGYDSIPILIKIAMHFSYLRYAMTGLVNVMMKGRPRLTCPPEEEFCIFTDMDRFIEVMGMDNSNVWRDCMALVACLVIVRGASFYLLRQRLSPNNTFMALQYIGRLVKSQFSIGR